MRTFRGAPPAPSRLCRARLAPSRCAAACVLLAALDASATAFFVNQQSVKGLGRVDAGNSAAADELGTIFFNPAGLTLLWDAQEPGWGDRQQSFSAGVNVIQPRGSQANAGSTLSFAGSPGIPYGGGNSRNPTHATPVPNIYYARQLGADDAIGFGMNVPFGLSAEFDPGWYGRYDATEASLRTMNVSVVGAHRFGGHWSVGGGLDVQYARTTLTQSLPNFPTSPTAFAPDARVYTHGDAWTPGFNAGVIYAFDDDDRIGVHYRSGMKHKIKGTSDFSGLQGPLAPFNGLVDARADLKLPAIATVGARVRLAPALVGLADLAWYDWSTFDEVRIRFADGRDDGVRPSHYRDAYGVAVGVEYREGRSPLTLRGGVHYDTTPTVDTYRDVTVPDSERLWLGVGATYRPMPHFEVDFAFTHVFFRDTNIDVTRSFYQGAAVATVRGAVKTTVDTVALDFRMRF